LSSRHFPARIEALPPFDGPFDAFRLEARDCDVLFASDPAGRFEIETSEIELWFR
jgi:hypothetical protein